MYINSMRYIILIILAISTFFWGIKKVESDTSTIPYYMYNAASSFNLDVALLYAICRVESNCKSKAMNHDDGTKHEKSRGIVRKSYGLFQLQLLTAKSVGFKTKKVVEVSVKRKGKISIVKKTIDNREDLLRPETNTWYAAKLIRALYDKYKDTPKVLSAYNAGKPVSYNKEYVNKVLRQYARYKIDKKY